MRGLIYVIGARSAGLGLGSEFTIRLPISRIVSGSATRESEQLPTSALRYKVLIADDNRDAAESLAMLLEMNGHSVSVGYNGEEALQLARQALPNAMILDIGMPDMTGYEVARRVRAEPWGGAVHLIAVTGWGQKEDKARATAAGFDHHLTKPVDPDLVEKLLRTFFKDRRDIAGSTQ